MSLHRELRWASDPARSAQPSAATTLTVLLSTTALLACFVAPRLTAWAAPSAPVPAITSVSAIAPPIHQSPVAQRAQPIAEVLCTPASMDPSTPLVGVTRAADPLLIPELDVHLPPTRRVFWDDCPFCGMGQYPDPEVPSGLVRIWPSIGARARACVRLR